MKLFLTSLLVASLVSSAAAAQQRALRETCSALGMQPYNAANIGLGAGTVHRDRNTAPSAGDLICSDVFSTMPRAAETAVRAQVFRGTESGSTERTGQFGLSFLKGILGPQNDAKVDASIKRGNQWSLSTGPLTPDGQTLLGVYRFATSGQCLNELRSQLAGRQSLPVILVYQTAQTPELKYSVRNTRNASAGINIKLAELVSVNPSYKVQRSGQTELQVSGTPINVCYARERYRLRARSGVGPGRFELERMS